MKERSYIVEKKVRATSVQDALKKEKDADIQSVYEDDTDEGERERPGFKSKE